MKKIGFGLALMMMLVASCSDSESPTTFSCESVKSKCANDPKLDADQLRQCNEALGDAKCGQLYLSFFLCLADHQVCASDGTTDQDKTTAECTPQVNAVDTCAGVSDGGTGG
ncbi:MAG TPA: hypothetical protein VK540_25040 [Polyangiaceae bacterium]|jgi:hypothetical protein|nr:hypothetical protein [Polyangiaceae bacterium]